MSSSPNWKKLFVQDSVVLTFPEEYRVLRNKALDLYTKTNDDWDLCVTIVDSERNQPVMNYEVVPTGPRSQGAQVTHNQFNIESMLTRGFEVYKQDREKDRHEMREREMREREMLVKMSEQNTTAMAAKDTAYQKLVEEMQAQMQAQIQAQQELMREQMKAQIQAQQELMQAQKHMYEQQAHMQAQMQMLAQMQPQMQPQMQAEEIKNALKNALAVAHEIKRGEGENASFVQPAEEISAGIIGPLGSIDEDDGINGLFGVKV